jgi:hypothetical protein
VGLDGIKGDKKENISCTDILSLSLSLSLSLPLSFSLPPSWLPLCEIPEIESKNKSFLT